ncbi:hypothetical protein [Halomonas icarae]|uniref:Aldehyde dehydrogenase family protein n=1 Tax=Halomonas icarae TaxID=2691040 RepID=A0A7X4VZD7_9GAMM|nr:hypothetical protein [Halomonas icarae]NAW13134.1 hypothetical protein [Halomonas icarae]
MIYANPGQSGAVVAFESRYGNYIGGEFVPPVKSSLGSGDTSLTDTI